MKKIVLSLLGAALALTASAQSWEEAQLYSQNEYGGTARSIAMGNAFTAVGGDLGSLGINPAGSAVPGYSTMALTTGLSLSVANATSENPDLGFGDKVKTNYGRVKLPNIGFVLSMDTGRRSGLKRISFGFVSNSTADYTSRMYATGVNTTTSFCGAVASSAAGYPVDVLAGSGKYGWWNLDEYDESYGLPWRDIVAYRSGIIGRLSGAPDGRYLGLTDWDKGDGKNTGILAPLDQKFGFQTRGYKHDMVFNLGLNYDDELYVGANLGISLLSYKQGEYWYEAPANPSTFPAISIAGTDCTFHGQEMKRLFDASGAGMYLKAGVLWRPVAGLRVGAALQTPTLMEMQTRSAWYGKADVSGVNLPSSQSPEWDDYYAMWTPWIFNAGVAYTFGKVGLLSVDYEVLNYGRVRFRNSTDSQYFYGNNYFDGINSDIRKVLGVSHSIRAGLEINLAPGLAFRGGYSLTTSGEHNYLKWVYDPVAGKDERKAFPLSAQERLALLKQTASVGLGYASGAFFADVAFRYKTMPTMYVVPYQYLDYDAAGGTYSYTDKYVSENPAYDVPTILCDYRRFDILLTVGMRF